MKILKWLIGGLLAMVALLLVGGMFIPSTFTITRNVLVQAPPEKIYPLVADPRGWKAWSVWNRRDPGMAIEYFGPPSGGGAGWAWKSKSEGDGRMTFTTETTPQRLVYELYFPDFGTTSKGDLRFTPEGTGTRVSWTLHGDMGKNPLLHWMSLFMNGMLGKDFDGGLANLKVLAEKP